MTIVRLGNDLQIVGFRRVAVSLLAIVLFFTTISPPSPRPPVLQAADAERAVAEAKSRREQLFAQVGQLTAQRQQLAEADKRIETASSKVKAAGDVRAGLKDRSAIDAAQKRAGEELASKRAALEAVRSSREAELQTHRRREAGVSGHIASLKEAQARIRALMPAAGIAEDGSAVAPASAGDKRGRSGAGASSGSAKYARAAGDVSISLAEEDDEIEMVAAPADELDQVDTTNPDAAVAAFTARRDAAEGRVRQLESSVRSLREEHSRLTSSRSVFTLVRSALAASATVAALQREVEDKQAQLDVKISTAALGGASLETLISELLTQVTSSSMSIAGAEGQLVNVEESLGRVRKQLNEQQMRDASEWSGQVGDASKR